MARDDVKKIRSLRNKLHKSIKKNGLNSEETRKISDEIDILINEYYNSIERAILRDTPIILFDEATSALDNHSKNKIEETKYPEDSEMLLYFNMSYEALKVMTLQLEKFPTVNEWNKYAKENNYLSHLSLEYISKLDWNYLQVKIEREINFKKIQKN